MKRWIFNILAILSFLLCLTTIALWIWNAPVRLYTFHLGNWRFAAASDHREFWFDTANDPNRILDSIARMSEPRPPSPLKQVLMDFKVPFNTSVSFAGISHHYGVFSLGGPSPSFSYHFVLARHLTLAVVFAILPAGRILARRLRRRRS